MQTIYCLLLTCANTDLCFSCAKVEVMQSLQKPKKIGFRGSDGANYTFLAKPKDDLRKDQRLMELATGLNRCFALQIVIEKEKPTTLF